MTNVYDHLYVYNAIVRGYISKHYEDKLIDQETGADLFVASLTVQSLVTTQLMQSARNYGRSK